MGGGTLMTEKTKRKTNPRRRLLIRLITGIGILVTLISAGVYAFRPTGAQIVFIAPDDNGVDNIWIADLNTPENPHQLTHYADVITFYGLHVFREDDKAIYGIEDSNPPNNFGEIRLLNLRNGTSEQLMSCPDNASCKAYSVHPDAQLIAYQVSSRLEDRRSTLAQLYLYDVQSAEHHLIYETQDSYANGNHMSPTWIPDTDLLTFRMGGIDNIANFAVYDVQQAQLLEDTSVISPVGEPFFSMDGSRYIHQSSQPNAESTFYDIRDFSNNSAQLLELENVVGGLYYQDWHPDNETVMMVIGLAYGFTRATVNGSNLNLYNTTTGEGETLTRTRNRLFIHEASFNHAGNQILYTVQAIGSTETPQIMLYDMETREEITLPLFGHSPQWVNGGR